MISAKPVGLVGIGPLGVVLARRLAGAGQRVVAFDAAVEARRILEPARAPIEFAASLFDVAAECEIVLAALPTTAGLVAAVTGDDDRPGLGAALQPGALIIDMADVGDPRIAPRLQGLLGQAAIGLVDAPVTHRPEPAQDDELTFLLGGYPDFADRAAQLLGRVGRVVRTGPLGTGHAAASVLCSTRAAIAAARSEARRAGSDAGIVPGVIESLVAEALASTR